MLKIIKSLEALPFASLMEIYIEGNYENSAQRYPNLSKQEKRLEAEQDFYHYLRSFFQTSGAFYALWEIGGELVSALRIEPYADGVLLSALETRPDKRNRGYAKALICAVLSELKGKVYSHISKENAPSVAVHKAVGFREYRTYSILLDGSVSQRLSTYLYDD